MIAWKAYVTGAAGIAILAAGILVYGNSQYRAGQEDCKTAHTLAELEQFKQTSNELAGLSLLLEGAAQTLASTKPKTIERYTRVEVQSPLPAGCVRDPGRVRATNDAIREANAARQSLSAVPTRGGR